MTARHIIVCEGINPAKAHKLAAFADDLEIGEELGRDIAASGLAMPSARSGVLRTEPCFTVSALRAPAAIARKTQ